MSYDEEWMKNLRAELARRENEPCGLGRDWDAIKQLLERLDAESGRLSWLEDPLNQNHMFGTFVMGGSQKALRQAIDAARGAKTVSAPPTQPVGAGLHSQEPARLPEQSEVEGQWRLEKSSRQTIHTCLEQAGFTEEQARQHFANAISVLQRKLDVWKQSADRHREEHASLQRENENLSLDLEKVQIKNDSYYQRLNMAEAALRKAQYWIKTPTFGEQRARDTNPDRRKEWSELVSEIDAALATATEIKA